MVWVYEQLHRALKNQFGGLDQLADRSLRMREVPGSKPGFSIAFFVCWSGCFLETDSTLSTPTACNSVLGLHLSS